MSTNKSYELLKDILVTYKHGYAPGRVTVPEASFESTDHLHLLFREDDAVRSKITLDPRRSCGLALALVNQPCCTKATKERRNELEDLPWG